MKSFYKYIIYFLLGLIIYSLIFVKDIIEGLTPEEFKEKILSHNQSNKGCEHYNCKNNESTYDNYELKMDVGDDNHDYYNCTNISNEKYLINNPNVIPCSNEICCDNHVCKSRESTVKQICGNTNNPNTIFMPNIPCHYSSDPSQQDTCTENTCCRSITDNTTANSNHGGLFEDIIYFRNNKGGNISNGNNITGEDIRNYLYYSLLNLVAIDVVNNPLTPESRNEEDKLPRSLLRNNNYNRFKNDGDTISKTNCVYDQENLPDYTPLDFPRGTTFLYPNYPEIGNKYSLNVYVVKNVDRVINTTNSCPEGSPDRCTGDLNTYLASCNHIESFLGSGGRQGSPQIIEASQSTTFHPIETYEKYTIKSYKYLDDKETLNYNDYELLSKWISGLDITNTDAAVAAQEVNKLILIPNLERDGNLRSSLNYIINIIDNTNSEITKSDIKKMIIN